MKSQIWLYLFCGAGLFWALNRTHPSYSKVFPSKISPQSKARAYVLGEKFQLTRKEVRAHRKLHLIHLFTPSGMHLSALLFLPALLLKRRKKAFFFLLTTVFVGALYFEAPHSFRRMCLVLGLTKVTKQLTFQTVLWGFTLDLALGGFWASPLSWFMSLLFLGTLTLQLYQNKRSLYVGFLGAQALVGLIFQQPIYPLGMALGWIVTDLFPWLFPLLLIESFPLPGFPLSHLLLFTIQKLSLLAGPELPPLLGLIIALFYFSKLSRYAWLLLLLSPVSLPNLPRHYQKATPFPSPPPHQYENKKNYAWGTQFIYQNGMICRSRLYQKGWSTRCKK